MSKFDRDVGLIFISESCEHCNSKGTENLRKSKDHDLFYVEFESNLQDFDVLNRNNRNYDRDNIWERMHSERITSMINAGCFAGELGHPIAEHAGDKLSQERLAEALYSKRAFFISKPELNGNVMKATIRTSCNSEGIGYAKDIIAGLIPQFSLRAFAVMTDRNGKPYVNVKHICTYDSVLFPSHAIAHMTSKPDIHTISISESTSYENTIDNSTIIPIDELKKDIKDSNIDYIMEAYDLTNDNIIGFDKSKEHAIIRDDNNIIYGNLNRNTIRKIKDFYSSF